MVQLDALRAFAIIGVLFHHFWPTVDPSLENLGHLGVRLFFVLSGYLITLILLRCRELVEVKGQGIAFTLRQFYIRRFLRIFPVFYLVLFAAYLLGLEEMQKTFWWHFSYGSNFLFALQGYFGKFTGHFWSLAVEEQFYLIWPSLIFVIPRKYLHFVIIGVIASGPLFRAFCWFTEMNMVATYAVPLASADSLGMGALLAYAQNKQVFRNRMVMSGVLMVSLTLIWELFYLKASFPQIEVVVMDIVRALAFVWLIDCASRGFGGFVGRVLELKPIVYLGKISYGVYVYHMFIPFILQNILDYLGMPLPESEAGQFFLLVFATLAIAVPSWHFFEKPINNLKKGFAYKKKKTDVVGEDKILLKAEA